MSIIGLDLAGLETRPTGFCLLSGMKAETTVLYTNDEVLRKTEENNPLIIAIDAPLSLPAGRKSLDDRQGDHLRESERELLKHGKRFFLLHLDQ